MTDDQMERLATRMRQEARTSLADAYSVLTAGANVIDELLCWKREAEQELARLRATQYFRPNAGRPLTTHVLERYRRVDL